MAVGDVKSAIVRLDPEQYLDIRPPFGEEWVIHNIVCSGSCELYVTDGTNYILVDSCSGSGAWLGFAFHVTNSIWYAVKNVDTKPILVSYDGVQTK